MPQKKYERLAESVLIAENPIRHTEKDEALLHAGTGRSAAVFRIAGTEMALKVFAPAFSHIALEEAEIYGQLEGSVFYPRLHEKGDNYIVIDYIEGQTFFECLTNGTQITPDDIARVDAALGLARAKGLNPSDIHLKNLFKTAAGEIMLIDVARFRQASTCRQWEDLKYFFCKFYFKPLFPKRFPEPVLNGAAFLYKRLLKRRSC
ncbi:protein kinase family protein [Bacillus infantis]|uniref:protein kinase family protein n=1 Tax=Bacillus infantis TaxID=324767 RepID=UPI001CD578F9|nr:protein kinase family protein [Bacillus infantis]MCA1039296.1 protein kinase family protein [Bacillus infantis]